MGWERCWEGLPQGSEGILEDPRLLLLFSHLPSPEPGKGVRRQQGEEEVTLPEFFFSPKLAGGRAWQEWRHEGSSASVFFTSTFFFGWKKLEGGWAGRDLKWMSPSL